MEMQVNKIPRPLSEINNDIGDELSDIILKALEKNPEDRYRDCDKFMSVIKNYQKR